ncbi:hypothetical protein Trydic_g22322 [Trypoxylus dichotomus]
MLLASSQLIVATRYQTLVKSEFPLEELEQVDRKGHVFTVPLVPTDRDIPTPDLEYGLRVIKVNRKPFAGEHDASQSFTSPKDHKNIIKNRETVHKEKHEDLKKFHYTYTVPDHDVFKQDSSTTNKNLDDKSFVLPKKEIEQAFVDQKVNVDVVSQKKNSSKAEAKQSDEISATSSQKSQASSKEEDAGASSAKPEEKKKPDVFPKVELNLFVDKLKNKEHNVDNFHIFNPYTINNYDLYKHIYNRFLVSEWNYLPHHLGATPNVVNIYYDKRYMQNAPGSHSFIYGTPTEAAAIVSEPIQFAEPLHIPQTVQVPHSAHLPQSIHSFQPIKLPETVAVPQPSLVYLEQPPLVYPFSSGPLEFQAFHQTPEEVHGLHLKELVAFHPVNSEPHVEKKTPGKHFFPKFEVVNKFDERTVLPSGVPQEKYGLPDVDRHLNFKKGCKVNCFPHATKAEYGVPVLEVSKVKLPSSYEVPVY